MAGFALNLASMLSPSQLTRAAALTQSKTQAAATTGTTTTGTSSTSNSDSGLTSTSTGQEFLGLLVKELQNQDPSDPVDATTQVGQLISLNQLDQLISINQTLGSATGSSSSPGSGATTGVVGATAQPSSSSAEQLAERDALLKSTQNLTPAQLATQAAADPTTTLNLSALNAFYGGK